MHPLKMLSAVAALAMVVHAGDYSTWARYRTVTLSTSSMGLSAAVANFPMPVRFKASTHADMISAASTRMLPGGADIRVTKADGTTDVPFEIEYADTGAAGALHLWVLADNVPANNPAAATYRVYWGKAGQTSMSNPTATFPTSAGFQAVFHLNDTGAVIANAANSGLNGSAFGTSTTLGQSAAQGYVSAKVGRRVRAFGNSGGGESNDAATANYIKLSPGPSHILSTHTGALTLEGWVYSSISNSGNTSQGTKHIIAHGDGNTGGKAWFARTASLDGSTGQNHYSAGGPNSITGPIAPFGEQHHWQFVTAVYNGTNWAIYRNRENGPWNNPEVAGPTGMTPDSATYKIIPAPVAPTAGTLPWYIGGAATGPTTSATDTVVTRGWQGWMEEVRVSTVARDSNYVKLNFLTSRADTLLPSSGGAHPITIGGTELVASQGSYLAWSEHRSIRLNTGATGANVAGTVTNFPVLVRLGTAEASIIAAANGGNSLRFSKANNTTALPYQIESWTSNAAAIWVKVDSVKGNDSNQTIRMHWGNSAATSESNGAVVFDTAGGYRAVFHMNEATGNITDATANAVVGTNTGTTTAPGIAGPSRNFGGTNAVNTASTTDRQYIELGAPTSLNFNGPTTFSAWIRYTNIVGTGGTSVYRTIINRDGASGSPSQSAETFLRIGQGAGNTLATSQYSTGKYTGSADIIAMSANPASSYGDSALWTHLAGVYDSTSTTSRVWRLYRNGVQIATSTDNASAGVAGAATLWRIGRGPGTQNARFFAGDIDEIRIDAATRDSNYIKLSYQNQREVNTLANIGLPVYTAPGQPTAVTAIGDTGKARISWTAPANNGGKPITGYKVTVVGDTTLSCETATTTCNVLNLAGGSQYNFVVRAINEVGGGANSTASNIITVIAPVAPTAPRTPSAVVNSGNAVTVSWTAPANTGGAAIASYTVTAAPGGATCTTPDGATLSCQVTGLTGSTAYTFSIVATNSAGTGPAVTVMATTTAILPGAFIISMDAARNPYTYRLPAASVASTQMLSMVISDVQGKRIWERTINPSATKVGEIMWNGTTAKGQAVSPGLYVVRIKAEMNGNVIESVHTGIKQ